MKRDLTIAACGACPFAGFSGPDPVPEPVCKAGIYLAPEAREWARPFGVWDFGVLIFPSPPPDWCPLRAGAVMVRVKPTDEGDAP